ncbi:DUF3947 family protein [Bacillus cereus]|uniref:DUF3947 family protein n=1 Tax=Bacillus cereus TaxID=1396 RepID=UPI000BF4A47F|nr:DUF3947 family protein [Bacillus cereus]PES28182.1 hypothetical protein CN496_20495 [Bacillus cereus]PET68826.1 hypothetical protein CN528_31085 [Bacillus cereus]
MFFDFFYNKTQMRPLGGSGPAQSTIQAVHQAIQAQQQALQSQQTQPSYTPVQSYYSLQSYFPAQSYYPM